MNYRELGKTGLLVSEIGFGAEWLEHHDDEKVNAIARRCEENGINIVDCWMSDPVVRSKLGKALKGRRDKWIIQGHIGSTWQNGQYERSRDIPKVKEAFEDLLTRLETDYIDLGMIHFIDEPAEFRSVMNGAFIEYVRELKSRGTIHHIGLSTHNPEVARLAAESGEIEMILFSINPAFDMLPATEDINTYFAETYDEGLNGIDPVRTELYKLCESKGVGITVMKGYAGGRLFSAEASPFGIALTPVQCLHYALTRPAVASVMAGFNSPEHVTDAIVYETATDEEKDYRSILAKAPHHAHTGQCTYCGHCAPCPVKIDIATVGKLYDLATMHNAVPPTVRAHYKSLAANANDCIACGDCEKRCPFGVPIVDRMKHTKQLFD